MIQIKNISGIRLHYARLAQHPYGSKGRLQKFWVDDDFHQKLVVCFDEVFEHCPLKKPKIITCAGIHVDKPNSHHKHGKAFDLDACFWSRYSFITNYFYNEYELYIGIESLIRKHFGTVLNYFYNNAHKDHFHINSSTTLAFHPNQRSKILYVQMALKYIYRYDILIDAALGPQTKKALLHILKRLNISGNITSKTPWLNFLTKTGIIAFKLFRKNKTPNRLLDNVYATINDNALDGEVKMKIINSLNELKYTTSTQDIWKEVDEQELLNDIIAEVIDNN